MEIISTVAATCLAMNLFLESRSEPPEGQIAVAQVTVRRADYRSDNVCKVVMQRKQFSWTNGTDGNGRDGFDPEAWRSAMSIARRALLWGRLQHFEDRSNGATHYATTDADPYWAEGMVVTAEIANHIFYRETRRRPRLDVKTQLEAVRRMQ